MTSVLHLTRNTRITGGGPLIMSNLIGWLSEYDHKVGGVLTERAIHKAEKFQDRIGLINSCAIPTPLDLISQLRSYRLSKLASILLANTFPIRMSRRFRPYGFSLVHSHYSNAIDKQAKAILNYMKVPMVWTAHSVPVLEGQTFRQLKRFNSICKEHRDLVSVVAVSEAVKSTLQSLCPDARIELIYNAAEVSADRGKDRLEFLYSQGICHSDPFVVCSVGRLNPEKGVSHLIQAARQVVAENEQVFFIHLGDGYERAKLLKSIEEHHLKEKFLLLGQKEDVGTYLRASNLFVLPSLNEAFGLSLLEALMIGLPSIVSNVGGIPEVTNSNCSIFVSPGNDRGIADAILKLARDAGRMGEMRAAALEQSKKFSTVRMISQYRSLYQELLGRHLHLNS